MERKGFKFSFDPESKSARQASTFLICTSAKWLAPRFVCRDYVFKQLLRADLSTGPPEETPGTLSRKHDSRTKKTFPGPPDHHKTSQKTSDNPGWNEPERFQFFLPGRVAQALQSSSNQLLIDDRKSTEQRRGAVNSKTARGQSKCFENWGADLSGLEELRDAQSSGIEYFVLLTGVLKTVYIT